MLKKYLMFAGLIGGMVISSYAKAFGDLEWQPRVGLQYQYSNYSAKAAFSNFIPKKYNHIGIMAGVKISNILGFDFEYMYSAEKKKNAVLLANSTFLGAAVGAADVNYINKVKMNYVGIDMNVYVPFNDNLSLIIAPGVVIGTPNYTMTAATASNLATAVYQLEGKMKTIPRVSVGFEYIEEDVGVKILMKWINSSKAKMGGINTDILNAEAERTFKDAMAMGFSVYVRV
ncbi:MAG: outer membrane beta-barrel protein [Francisellaceae bacterium]|jgi:hypothetical protein|nr:outer membrane beta-barrel protein [Francisellaceae bacterium]MBT6208325.1 outer membrane beta-barrel protein [Francisellaceae bacterium]MBT6537931.1 outer membrane beta-barrel protein [Francisellaceae bacterium]